MLGKDRETKGGERTSSGGVPGPRDDGKKKEEKKQKEEESDESDGERPVTSYLKTATKVRCKLP